MKKELTPYQIKKNEKRLKQREANIGRAKKMHEARIKKSEELELIVVKKPKKTSTQRIYIGCSGWFYWDWKGLFYPSEISTAEWFDYYAKNFKTVELNAPFYSWPTIATVKTWIRQAKESDFIYTVKVCELITHIKRFKKVKTLVKDFGLIADLLGPKMGCFLFQLPPSYRYSEEHLQDILSQLDHSRKNVVEFRHKSWWNETVYESFKKTGTIFCSCSGPKLPEELVKTADDIYIRFHGTVRWYRHDYTKEQLEIWAKWIKESGAKNIWIYFNNDHDAYAIKNARELEELIENHINPQHF
ncbi:MAG: hypothetical protein K0R25_1240 [Rickettsiaceae bacterium]|jgi:uncharacterized protein YecE (DUF72 family)|nr:hypothetical protein [Rickettsiaceae bacterium]